MSALGQKQTFRSAIAMSALPPKADIRGAKRNVHYGPIADINQLWLVGFSRERRPRLMPASAKVAHPVPSFHRDRAINSSCAQAQCAFAVAIFEAIHALPFPSVPYQ